MDNTSPARSSDSERNKGQHKGSPSTLGKNSLSPNLKSCFSDDERKSEDEQEKNIEDLADEHELKSSRQDLFECMSAMMKTPNSAPKSRKQLQSSIENIKETYYTSSKEAKSASYHSPNIPQQKDTGHVLGDIQGEERSPGVFSPIETPGDKKNVYLVEHSMPIPSIQEDPAESCQMDEINIEAGTLQAIPEIRFEDLMHSQEKAFTGELPAVEGFLQKKSSNLFGWWQRRYFALKNKKLYYYSNEKKEVKSGVIDFDLVSVKLERGNSKTELRIRPIGGSRIFRLRTTTEEEREKWFIAIEKHVQASKGAASTLSKVASLKQFWKNDRISVSMFIDEVETGDILLFKSETILSKIQRSVTGSQFDHVALVVKYGNNQIFLFEAMREGVGLCRWTTFMDKNWNKLYEKVIYRKLVVPRTQEMTNEIHKFVKSNVGKKFKISPKKLLKKKSSTNNTEDKTFFCSELVASCYKKLGFLPLDISAANYYPGTFAAEKKLMLLNNAKLSQEYLIDFNL